MYDDLHQQVENDRRGRRSSERRPSRGDVRRRRPRRRRASVWWPTSGNGSGRRALTRRSRPSVRSYRRCRPTSCRKSKRLSWPRGTSTSCTRCCTRPTRTKRSPPPLQPPPPPPYSRGTRTRIPSTPSVSIRYVNINIHFVSGMGREGGERLRKT